MHCTRLAPELSATSSTVRIWIMARLLLHELLDEADHGEALVPADRAVLLDLDLVACLVLALLVVRLVAAARAHVLAVERVAAVRDHFDHDRLRHLRADDLADHLASEAVRLVGGAVARFGVAGGLLAVRVRGHDCVASPFLAGFFLSAAVALAALVTFAALVTLAALAALAAGAAAAWSGSGAAAATLAAGATPPRLRAWRSVMTRARSRRVLPMTLVSSSLFVKFFSRYWKVSCASDACSSRRSSTLFSRRSEAFM